MSPNSAYSDLGVRDIIYYVSRDSETRKARREKINITLSPRYQERVYVYSGNKPNSTTMAIVSGVSFEREDLISINGVPNEILVCSLRFDSHLWVLGGSLKASNFCKVRRHSRSSFSRNARWPSGL